MRLLGVLALLIGGGGTAYATFATYAHSRPRDVVFGLLAPVALLLALTGLLLLFVPGFFDG